MSLELDVPASLVASSVVLVEYRLSPSRVLQFEPETSREGFRIACESVTVRYLYVIVDTCAPLT